MKIRNKIFWILLSILSVVTTSCNQEEKTIRTLLQGNYVLQSYLNDGEEILQEFSLNLITFGSEDKVELPVNLNDHLKSANGRKRSIYDLNDIAHWIILKKDGKFYIEIQANRYWFEGTYEISFEEKGNNQNLIIILENAKTKIVAVKQSFPFSINKAQKNKLKKYFQKETRP